MDKLSLQNEILKLIKTSTISDHSKKMVEILLPVMNESVLEKIYKDLMDEKSLTGKLEDKKKRIELKYQVMADKLDKTGDNSKKI